MNALQLLRQMGASSIGNRYCSGCLFSFLCPELESSIARGHIIEHYHDSVQGVLCCSMSTTISQEILGCEFLGGIVIDQLYQIREVPWTWLKPETVLAMQCWPSYTHKQRDDEWRNHVVVRVHCMLAQHRLCHAEHPQTLHT